MSWTLSCTTLIYKNCHRNKFNPPKSTTSILKLNSTTTTNNNVEPYKKKQSNSFSARVKPVKAVLNQYARLRVKWYHKCHKTNNCCGNSSFPLKKRVCKHIPDFRWTNYWLGKVVQYFIFIFYGFCTCMSCMYECMSI